MSAQKIIIATRKSKLALWQSNFVKFELEKKYPELKVELMTIETQGDLNQVDAYSKINGKSIFVKALQETLLDHRADLAVHSIKDMSVHPVKNLLLTAVCKREDAHDAFISEKYIDLDALPAKAVIGSSSPRRTALLRSIRRDIQIKLLRGNVDTRIQKLQSGEYDAIVLAAAGLKRLGLTDHIKSYFSIETFIPAIGQGAIGIECRESDLKMREITQFLNHAQSQQCIIAERMVNHILNGNCNTPIGAYAITNGHKMKLRAILANDDGSIILQSELIGSCDDPEKIGEQVAKDLLKQGAKKLCLS